MFQKKLDVTCNQSTLTYCAALSRMIIYPSDRILDIVLSTMLVVYYNVEFSFSVTDPSRVITCSPRKNTDKNLLSNDQGKSRKN